MVRTKSNHILWLLQHTSEHHRPGRLAAAVALGLVAGFVPKANLLAIALYTAVILLPIHSILGLAVSLLTTCLASYSDPVTHGLGNWLLRQEILRPVWSTIDNAPVLPWLALHNTVVLGSFLIGIVSLGPVYLISLRLFEQWLFQSSPQQVWSQVRSASCGTERAEQASRARTRSKRHLPTARPTAQVTSASSNDEVDYDPVWEVTPIINSWHMGHASSARKSLATVGASDSRQPSLSNAIEGSLDSRYHLPTRSAETTNVSISSSPAFQNYKTNDDERLVPPVRPAGDSVDSLQLAHSASDVLAWADDLLDECLAAEGMTLVSTDLQCSTSNSTHDESPSEFDVIPIAGSHDERWVMETTIEIVRWAEDADTTPPAESIATTPFAMNLEQRDTMLVQQSSNTFSTTVANTATFAGPAISDSSGGHAVAHPDQPARAPNGFQQREFSNPSTITTPSAPVAAEPVRGECLGFLLGHLRQTRQGKST